jgi:hypothetical protein
VVEEPEPDGRPREPVRSTQVFSVEDFERAGGPAALKCSCGDQRVLDDDGQGPEQIFTGTPLFGAFSDPTALAPAASQAQARWFDDDVIFEP